MKNFLPFFLLLVLTTVASADDAVVYSGVATMINVTPSGTVKSTRTIYVMADISDTTNFAVMEFDPVAKTYLIDHYPSASPTTEEANNNFFGGVSSAKVGGTAVFRFNRSFEDSDGNTLISHLAAMGDMTIRPTVLVHPRLRDQVVVTKTDGVPSENVTYLAGPGITTGSSQLPLSLTGSLVEDFINADGTLHSSTAQGAITLKVDANLTALANLGGGLTVGRNVFAIDPVGGTYADVFDQWLQDLASDYGYTATQNFVGSGSGSLSSGGSGSVITWGGSGYGFTLNTGLGFGGTVNVGGGTLNISGGSLGIGAIESGASLTKSGNGTWIISTNNSTNSSNSSATTLGGGILRTGGTEGGSLVYISNNSWGGSTSISLGTGGVLQPSGGTLNLGTFFNGGGVTLQTPIISTLPVGTLRLNTGQVVFTNSGSIGWATGTTSGQ